jgi:RNA polymerase sigma-70 factor (ECF subfamily)
MFEPRTTDDPFTDRLWRFRPTLLRRARRHLPSAAWAEDAVAETLLAAIESRHRLHELDSLEAWLSGVLRHKVADQVRLHRPALLATPGTEDAPSAEVAEPAAPEHQRPERIAEWRQWVHLIDRQLDRLPPMQARALRLHLVAEAGASEIAEAMGITANHGGVLLHRARSRLRSALAAA